MALARKCDICGDFYNSYNEKRDHENPNTIKFGNKDLDNEADWHPSIDCCPTCMGSIMACVNVIKHK